MRDSTLILPPWTDKQIYLWESKANEQLIAGATRSGKSFYVRKAYIRWCSEIPGLQTDIFRLNFDDVIAENMEGETSFPLLLDIWVKDGLVKITETEITFWNESKITLKHCSDDKVMQKWQGIPSHARTWGEAAQIPKHRMNWLNKWVTMSEEMKSRVPDKWKGTFPKILYPTNPIGISATYFKREFVDFGAFKNHSSGDFIREYIPMTLIDNPHEDQEATKRRFKNEDPVIAKAMLYGSFDSVVGEYFPEWDEKRHWVPDFIPPPHFFRFRAIDWGTAEPFCVLWACVSDGKEFIDEEGRKRWFPRGSFIIYNEWYGCDPKDGAIGNRMRNEDIAAGILIRSELNHQRVITLCDSLPFQDRGGETIADVFRKAGVPLTLADTSRIPGWSQMRSRLIGIQADTNSEFRNPMLYLTHSCPYGRTYIPALTRHKSEGKLADAQEHGEATHWNDTCRYICMAHTIIRDIVINVAPKFKTDNLSQSPKELLKLIKKKNAPRF